MPLRLLLFLVLGLAVNSAKAEPKSPDALWRLLASPQEKGLVLMMRHALAPGTGDPANFQLGDCSTQRNLSEEGRTQARAWGTELRRRGVRVSEVRSSQWCRCLDTGTLLNAGPVRPWPPLNSFFAKPNDGPERSAAVQKFLEADAGRPGEVRVFVTHQVNVELFTDVFPRAGEAVVLRWLGAGKRPEALGTLYIPGEGR